MNIIAKKINQRIIQFSVLLIFLFVSANQTQAQATDNTPQAKAIISAMNNSADEWNKGNLDAFMGMYDPSATM